MKQKYQDFIIFATILLAGLAFIGGVIFLACGCISANASTGSSTEASQKGTQSQSTSQSVASTDSVELSIEPSVITQTLTDKTVLTVSTGGGVAKTGSKQEQKSEVDQWQKFQQWVESKLDANAESSVNMSYIIIACIIGLLLFSAFKIWLYKK